MHRKNRDRLGDSTDVNCWNMSEDHLECYCGCESVGVLYAAVVTVVAVACVMVVAKIVEVDGAWQVEQRTCQDTS